MNFFILEDQWIEQINLEKVLNSIAKEQQIAVATIKAYATVDELTAHLPAPSMDNVYLLGLEVAGDTKAGLKVSRLVRQYDPYATIIFITVHDELLPATYRYQAAALDFISKGTANITERLRQDITLVNQKIKQIKQLNQPTILLKIGTGYTWVALADILYFAPNPRNLHQSFLYLTNDQQITVHGSLTSLERGNQFFFRSHRHCLINITKVSQINTHDHTVVLAHICPLSRLKTAALLNQLAAVTNTKIT